MKICRSFLLLLLVVTAVLALSSAAVAADISGTVTYYGEKTGRIFITLESQYNSSQAYGTSIVSSGTFTIRGVPEGGYTLIVRLDAVGNRERHPADPIYIDSSIYVPANDVSGVNLYLDDPSPAAPQPPATLDTIPGDSSNFLMWEPQRDQNGVHGSETFDLYWSTDPSFLASWPTVSADGSITGIKSSDNDNGYFHTGLTNGQTYYYLMTGTTGTLVSTATVTAVVAPASPVGGYEVSGTITASGFDPAGSTLYAVLYSDTDGVYYSIINNPVSSQTFTVAGVPDGTFFVYPIYDMNGNGLMDAGDVSPGDGMPSQVTVNGSNVSGVAATLTAAAGSAMAGTSHWKRDNGCSEGYSINLRAEDGLKLIANVALTSAPTNSVAINGPIDLGSNQWGEFSYYTQTTGRPAVGDSFSFDVEYIDGSTETLNAQVTAVLDDFPVPVSPVGMIANESTPTFTWSAPSSSPSYEYTYQMYLYGQNTNWSVWDMPSSKLSAVYNENGEANPSTLNSNASYEWSITLRDDDGNEAQTQVNFGMGSGISGTVTNGSTGVGCVQVSVVSAANGSPIAWTRTNPDGTYNVGVTAGAYKVEFMGNYAGYISEWYDNQTDWTAANTVTVLADQTTGGINAVLSQAGSISGQVTNGTSGIANVWVEVYDASTYGHLGSSQTDADGNYTIGGLPTGTYKVVFGGVAGYSMEWYDDAQDQASATSVPVTAGSPTTGVDAVLSASGDIAGTVTDGANGIQYMNVSACRWDVGTQMCSPYYYAMTDSSGNYSLTGLPTGQYKVQFNGEGVYLSEWYNDTQDMNLATVIGVSAGATTSGINAVLTQAGAISGRVTSNGTTGIPSAPVSVVNASTGAYIQSTMTDPAGYYTVNIAAGQYKVSFDATGFITEWYNDKTSFESADTVTVTGGIMTNSIDAVLSLAGPQPSPNILWRNTATGDVYLWTMNGTAQTGGVTIGNIPDPSWQVVGEADFNNDGSPDILWRNSTTGDVYVWTMTGTTHTGGLAIGNIPDPAWQIAATGDFNNDGSPDILWRNSDTGDVYVWIMTGTTHTGGVIIGNIPGPAWQIVGAADYTLDSNPDILWRNSTTGDVYVWTMTGTTHTGGVTIGNISDPAWQIVATGDFNGDVNNDILWRNTTTGDVYLWTMTGTTNTSGVTIGNIPDSAWHIVGPK